MDAKKLTDITDIEYIENVWITITHGITQGQQLFTGLKITTDDGIFYVNSPYKVKIFGENITISTSCMCVTFKVTDTPYTLDEIKDIIEHEEDNSPCFCDFTDKDVQEIEVSSYSVMNNEFVNGRVFSGLYLNKASGEYLYVDYPYIPYHVGDTIYINSQCGCYKFENTFAIPTLDLVNELTYKEFYQSRINEPVKYGSDVSIGMFKSVKFNANMSFDGTLLSIPKPPSIQWNYNNKIIRFSVSFDDGLTVRNMTPSWVYHNNVDDTFYFSVYDYVSIEKANPQFVQILMEFIEEP